MQMPISAAMFAKTLKWDVYILIADARFTEEILSMTVSKGNPYIVNDLLQLADALYERALTDTFILTKRMGIPSRAAF